MEICHFELCASDILRRKEESNEFNGNNLTFIKSTILAMTRTFLGLWTHFTNYLSRQRRRNKLFSSLSQLLKKALPIQVPFWAGWRYFFNFAIHKSNIGIIFLAIQFFYNIKFTLNKNCVIDFKSYYYRWLDLFRIMWKLFINSSRQVGIMIASMLVFV